MPIQGVLDWNRRYEILSLSTLWDLIRHFEAFPHDVPVSPYTNGNQLDSGNSEEIADPTNNSTEFYRLEINDQKTLQPCNRDSADSDQSWPSSSTTNSGHVAKAIEMLKSNISSADVELEDETYRSYHEYKKSVLNYINSLSQSLPDTQLICVFYICPKDSHPVSFRDLDMMTELGLRNVSIVPQPVADRSLSPLSSSQLQQFNYDISARAQELGISNQMLTISTTFDRSCLQSENLSFAHERVRKAAHIRILQLLSYSLLPKDSVEPAIRDFSH